MEWSPQNKLIFTRYLDQLIQENLFTVLEILYDSLSLSFNSDFCRGNNNYFI